MIALLIMFLFFPDKPGTAGVADMLKEAQRQQELGAYCTESGRQSESEKAYSEALSEN